MIILISLFSMNIMKVERASQRMMEMNKNGKIIIVIIRDSGIRNMFMGRQCTIDCQRTQGICRQLAGSIIQ